jgi:hypothetical protein
MPLLVCDSIGVPCERAHKLQEQALGGRNRNLIECTPREIACATATYGSFCNCRNHA